MADESVGERLGAAVVSAVQAVNAAMGSPLAGVPVVLRRVLVVADATNLPAVVVTVADDDTDPADFDHDTVRYTVFVVLATKVEAPYGDVPVNRRWLQRVRRKLRSLQVLDGVPEVIPPDAPRGLPFDLAAVQAGVNYTYLRLRYSAIEPRE